MRNLAKKLEPFAEKLFITLGIILLPLWFPLVLIWVVVDPVYRIRLGDRKATRKKG
jgi:hypothetical protein